MPTIHNRIIQQIELILDKMEEHPERYTTKDRLALVEKAGMFLTRDIKLRAANESEHSGSAVRKYANAFKAAHERGGAKGSAGRTKRAGSNGAAAPDTSGDPY